MKQQFSNLAVPSNFYANAELFECPCNNETCNIETSQRANQPGGEQAKERTSQGANRPESEPAMGRKSHNLD